MPIAAIDTKTEECDAIRKLPIVGGRDFVLIALDMKTIDKADLYTSLSAKELVEVVTSLLVTLRTGL
jgi:hypothetical protein